MENALLRPGPPSFPRALSCVRPRAKLPYNRLSGSAARFGSRAFNVLSEIPGYIFLVALGREVAGKVSVLRVMKLLGAGMLLLAFGLAGVTVAAAEKDAGGGQSLKAVADTRDGSGKTPNRVFFGASPPVAFQTWGHADG